MSIFEFTDWEALPTGRERKIRIGDTHIATVCVYRSEGLQHHALLVPNADGDLVPYVEPGEVDESLSGEQINQEAMHHALILLPSWLSTQISEAARTQVRA